MLQHRRGNDFNETRWMERREEILQRAKARLESKKIAQNLVNFNVFG
jgi:hypothetical protein